MMPGAGNIYTGVVATHPASSTTVTLWVPGNTYKISASVNFISST